jgi:hypothetical protein
MTSGVDFGFGLDSGDCARVWLASKIEIKMSAAGKSLIKRKRFRDFMPDDNDD